MRTYEQTVNRSSEVGRVDSLLLMLLYGDHSSVYSHARDERDESKRRRRSRGWSAIEELGRLSMRERLATFK